MSKRGVWLLIVLLVPALLVGSASGGEYRASYSKTLEVAEAPDVEIKHSSGDVEITGWKKRQVEIQGDIRVSARDRDVAKRFADEIRIEVVQDGKRVRIETIYPERSEEGGWSWLPFRKARDISYTVHLQISLPAGSDMNLENSSGNVSVNGIIARVDVKNAHGKLIAHGTGGVVNLENSFGDVEVQGGGEATVKNSHGAVRASDVQGATTVRNTFGRVDILRIFGDCQVENAHGQVEIGRVEGAIRVVNSFGAVEVSEGRDSCVVRNTNGAVRVEDIGRGCSLRNSFGEVRACRIGGSVDVHSQNSPVQVQRVRGEAYIETSFGGVHVEDVQGNLEAVNRNGAVRAQDVHGSVRAQSSFNPIVLENVGGEIDVENQNGNISVSRVRLNDPDHDIRLRTRFGRIDLELPEDASARLSMETSFGKLYCDFPVTVTLDDAEPAHVIRGKIGDGGPSVELRTTHADIRVKKGPG